MITTILIPTYENLLLLRGLLGSIYSLKSNIKVAIYDDSRSDIIFNDFNQLAINSPFPLVYTRTNANYAVKNRAAANWNRAINDVLKSNTTIYQVRHHDDYFFQLNQSFIRSLEAFEDSPSSIMITPTVKLLFQWRAFGFYRYHCPPLMLRFLIAMPPEILYYYNYIGPTSSVWLKKSSDRPPFFDTDLTWLVDVNWYSKLLRRKPLNDVYINQNAATISVQNHQSITSRLNSVAELQRSESAICLSYLSRSNKLRLLIIAQALKIVSFLISLVTPICCLHDHPSSSL
jgi:hypothetical protein